MPEIKNYIYLEISGSNKIGFPAKVLLLGEYSVILGSAALAVPFYKVFAQWKKYKFNYSEELLKLYHFLKKSQNEDLNLDHFFDDLMKGWYLESTIPRGKGLGSSASVVAAVLKKYGPSDLDDLKVLKQKFAEIESFYHGTSSGFDPLVVYTGKSIYKRNLELSKIDQEINLDHFFLLDSKIARTHDHSIPLIVEHIKKNKPETFIEIQNDLVEAVLMQNHSVEPLIKRLSQYQRNYLSMLIPENLYEVWDQGLISNQYYLKLCGAGGGGYYICYVKELDLVQKLPMDLIPLR